MRALLVMIVVLSACKSTANSQGESKYVLLAKELFPSGSINYLPNNDGELVLYFTNKNLEIGTPKNIAFFVYDIDNARIVHKRELGNGSVAWHSIHEIKIILVPGMMREGETIDDYTVIYNLISNEERKLIN